MPTGITSRSMRSLRPNKRMQLTHQPVIKFACANLPPVWRPADAWRSKPIGFLLTTTELRYVALIARHSNLYRRSTFAAVPCFPGSVEITSLYSCGG